MARKKQSRGRCTYCGRELAKAGITRHLPECPRRLESVAAADAGKGDLQNLYHLQVMDAHGGDFWLHLEMNGSATLKQLDNYLRTIWMECCGHLSEFSMGGWGTNTVGMNNRADRVFRAGVQLTHIYDFGTSSETLVKVLGVRTGKPTTRHPLALMARNDRPEVECMECEEPAEFLCMECVIEENEPGLLCKEHAKDHPHDEYGEPQPLVNSPRMGMCGYDGPAVPPY